ncbi:hypothetical protein PUNSTDRAFT_130433 [Punctularia strigosozonata HHB-11173 SS5]|uniref:uncharacterized protein n=1 Tax=Punctularia strigosozonata (strain HHB-11173) TaxID=741275 RepID=UPI00044186C1|nr:uncharacterized protein PUNSTDRAFT_130433 [Punctularia strigosozonata HHB-11173 SS5]EIN12165.1 hypothetical protein PUNSTDRAFT_130433 [Punctularia strigosozonata HHB-11173 SS5]
MPFVLGSATSLYNPTSWMIAESPRAAIVWTSRRCGMALIALDGLLGASLIGVLVSAVVFGITCLQIYLYFTEHSQNDSTLLKAFVLILFFLDTLHLALLSHSIYFYTVSCFGDYFALTVATWSLLVQIPISSIVTLSVQLFFAYRIHKLSDGHNWWMPLAICVLAAGEMAAGIGMTTVGFIIRKFAFEDRIVSWAASGLTAGFVCDTMITTGMVHYLNRNQSQFPRTQKAVSMLTNYALNTGLITTILALITLIVLLTHHEELIYAPFYFMLARVYACSFMSA